MVGSLSVATGSATLSSVTYPQKAVDANISDSDYVVLNITGTDLLTWQTPPPPT